MEGYLHLKAAHVIIGIVWVGNMIVTGLWKALADRTGDPRVVAFAQRGVTVTDRALTMPGAVLILVTGWLMLPQYGGIGQSPLWIHISLGLWFLAALISMAVLVPIQKKQRKLAAAFADGSSGIPDDYRRLARAWAVAGTIATLLPLLAVILMVLKQPM